MARALAPSARETGSQNRGLLASEDWSTGPTSDTNAQGPHEIVDLLRVRVFERRVEASQGHLQIGQEVLPSMDQREVGLVVDVSSCPVSRICVGQPLDPVTVKRQLPDSFDENKNFTVLEDVSDAEPAETR